MYIILIRHLPAGRLANINNDWVVMTEVHSSINNVLINVVLSTPKPDCDISNWIIRSEQYSLQCIERRGMHKLLKDNSSNEKINDIINFEGVYLHLKDACYSMIS